ncbi:MAG: repressor LexA [Eubacterium sp.]|nr:repressor LexA [Eubacterium sp.]
MGINTELLTEIKDYAERFYLENGVSPTVREIASQLGVGKSTVQRYLERLRDAGKIEYSGERSIKTEVTEKYNQQCVSVGLVGSISCGPLNFAEQNITDYFSLPYSMLGSGEFFMLRASGDSMINAGIDDGDLVVIRRQQTAREGDIVVALYGDDTTLKRFYTDRANHRFILHPENERLNDIIIEGDLIIQGVAVKVIKDL